MYQTSVIMKFPKDLVDQPFISHVIADHGVIVNILQASITPEEDGRMFAIFKGQRQAVERALRYLTSHKVRVILPAKNLIWDQDRCVHCSACVGQCPSSAFELEAGSAEVIFHADRCIACGLCIPACGYGAIESITDDLHRAGG